MSTTQTEYILIGSGVAAVTIAERLLAANPSATITILEAGKVYPTQDRRAWWDYVITGKAVYNPAVDTKDEYSVDSNVQWDCHDNRLIAYGGSTLHWGGWSLRFKPEDFHLRSNTGLGADWPFSYETLHNYYYEAEKRLAVCGNDSESWNYVRHAMEDERTKEIIRPAQPYPMPPFAWTAADGEMIDAFRALGIEPGRMPIARFRKCMATGTCKYCPLGGRYTAQDALDDLRRRENYGGKPSYPNLIVHQRAAALRILMSSKRRASGVEYVQYSEDKQETHTLLAPTVIVCAGTYESPKLLLQSANPAWPRGIGNDHDIVGRYLVSHSILRVQGKKDNNSECWLQEYDFPTLMSRTYDTPEYQRFGKLFIFKNRKLPNLDLAGEMSKGYSRKEIEDTLRNSRLMELQGFIEEKGKFDNYVTLSDEKTRWGLPKTRIVFNRTPEEIANCESRVELLQRVIRAMGYRVVIAQVDRPGGHHATGTCRMAHDPKDGVTDPELRVYGTDNLYVCSNAVFPTGSAVNPTLTLMALAMRLSDHLLRHAGDASIVTSQGIRPPKASPMSAETADKPPVKQRKPQIAKLKKGAS